VEILRCPTCLSLLFDPNVKRCPACHAKLRRRSEATVLAEADASRSNDGLSNDEFDRDLADRPLPLVQQELQARIEAKTARGFLQRRRAAKAARRIAALPSTVLAGDIVLGQAESEPPVSETTAPDEPREIIDLPAEAVHDVSSVAEADYVPAEPVVEPEPEPSAPARKPRRAPKAARIEGVLEGLEEVVEPPAPPKRKPRSAEPVAVEAVVDAPVEVAEPEVPEPRVPEPVVSEPEVPEPEVVVPEVIEPDPVPEPEVRAKPEIVESVPAVNWQRSTSAWTQRVFNAAPRVPEAETVTWPPRWKPADQMIDLTEDSDADQVDASR
jgi:hypothetical protein